MTEPTATRDAAAQGEMVADEVFARTSRFPEARMRIIYFCKRLAELDDEIAIEVLRALLTRATERHVAALEILSAMGEDDYLITGLGAAKVSRIYHQARRSEYDDVMRFLSRPRAVKQYGEESDVASMYAIQDRTAGEKRFIARTGNRETLDRLTYDLDPLVIRELLGNPRVTERMVMKIAARRPCTPEVLAEIARHPRWVSRPDLREAIIRNPYVDPGLALSLAPTLLRSQLKQVAGDAEVHEEVKRQVRDLLQRRDNRPEEKKPTD